MIYKSRTPIGFYVLLIAFSFSASYLIYKQMNIGGIIFYLSLLTILGLTTLSKSFIVKVYSHHLEIRYFHIFKKKVTIKFDELKSVEVEKGELSLLPTLDWYRQKDYIFIELRNGNIVELRPFRYKRYKKLINLLRDQIKVMDTSNRQPVTKK